MVLLLVLSLESFFFVCVCVCLLPAYGLNLVMANICLFLCLSGSSIYLGHLQGELAFTFASTASGFLLEDRLPPPMIIPVAVF